MKKIIAMITALSLCTTGLYFSINSDSALTSITASAETDFEFDAETGTIYGYNGSDTDIVIPSEIDGVAVTGIANYVFYENSTIKGISIPDSVTTIGRN